MRYREAKVVPIGFLSTWVVALVLLMPPASRADVFRITDGVNLMVVTDLGDRVVLANPPVRIGAPVSNDDDVRGMAAKPGTGELWIVTWDGVLATVAPTTGKVTRKGTVQGHGLVDLAFAPNGQLYGVSSCNDSVDPTTLFTVSPTGSLAKVVALAPPGVCPSSSVGALAFNDDGRLFFASAGEDDHTYVDAINLSTLAIDRVFGGEISYFFPTAMAFTADGHLRFSEYGDFGDLDLDAGDEVHDLGSATTPGVISTEYAEAYGMVRANPACVGTATSLCFLERFRVEVAYGPTATPAKAFLRNASEGFFAFGATGLADVTVRLTNTCVTKGKYGFFASGPTNAKLAIKVTDTKTGAIKTFAKAAGVAFTPVLAPAAFACP